MTHPPDQDQDQEHDLERRFDALRRADAQRTPSFDRTLAHAPSRARGRPAMAIASIAAALVVAVVAGFFTTRTRQDPQTPPDPVAIEHQNDPFPEMPTDFLLDIAAVDPAREPPALRRLPNDEVPFL